MTDVNLATRRALINALESKIVGARVSWLRAKDDFIRFTNMGLFHAAAAKKAEFVGYEQSIHSYSEELDSIRGYHLPMFATRD